MRTQAWLFRSKRLDSKRLRGERIDQTPRHKPMKTTSKSKMGVAILASSLSFVGTANAVDLILNGGFESVTGGTPQYGGRTDATEAGWNGAVSSLPYSGAYYSGPAIPASEGPSSFYSWRHQSAVGAYSLFTTPTTDLSYVTVYSFKQSVNLTNGPSGADIDAGRANTLSAHGSLPTHRIPSSLILTSAFSMPRALIRLVPMLPSIALQPTVGSAMPAPAGSYLSPPP